MNNVESKLYCEHKSLYDTLTGYMLEKSTL